MEDDSYEIEIGNVIEYSSIKICESTGETEDITGRKLSKCWKVQQSMLVYICRQPSWRLFLWQLSANMRFRQEVF